MDKAEIKKRLQNILGLSSEQSKILVVGLGKTGFSVTRFLIDNGINVVVVDSRVKPPYQDKLKDQHPGILVYTGGFQKSVFSGITHLIVSPGVSLGDDVIHQTVLGGAIVLSDIDLFACATNKPVIAITGSNGKSTVTTLLGEMAIAAGKNTAVGGNLGIPALDLITEDTELYVLELSSFQLERTSVLNADAATVLNVTPDHMDRHVDMVEYAKLKQRVFKGTGVMVLNADDARVMAMQEKARKTITFSLEGNANYHIVSREGIEWISHNDQSLLPVTALVLEGQHNIANAMAALALGTAVALPESIMCTTLKGFHGLEHRMQRVAEINGVKWINDSKATNIGACIAALQGYQKKVVLIAGGDAKGADMSELTRVVKDKVKAIILMGKDARLIEQLLNGDVRVFRADEVEQAVTIAARLAKPGDSVLLSPACASLDQYKNYQERGEKFSAAVRDLAA